MHLIVPMHLQMCTSLGSQYICDTGQKHPPKIADFHPKSAQIFDARTPLESASQNPYYTISKGASEATKSSSP